MVSVENLHVIILIHAFSRKPSNFLISFSRKPACYNTDTDEKLAQDSAFELFQSKTCML